jgi:hypothetical protein
VNSSFEVSGPNGGYTSPPAPGGQAHVTICPGDFGDAYTIAHESGHNILPLPDEYNYSDLLPFCGHTDMAWNQPGMFNLCRPGDHMKDPNPSAAVPSPRPLDAWSRLSGCPGQSPTQCFVPSQISTEASSSTPDAYNYQNFGSTMFAISKIY